MAAAMLAFLVVVGGFVLVSGFWAALIAVIVNLPEPPAYRFIMVAGAIWALWTLIAIQNFSGTLDRRLKRIEKWARAIYAVVGERAVSGITPDELREQIADAMALDREERQHERRDLLIGRSSFVGVILLILAVLLNYGVFGEVGHHWISDMGNLLVG